jgi:hypothetical protein
LKRGEATAQFSAGPASEDFGFFELLAETGPAKSRGLSMQEFSRMSAIERVSWRWALINEKAMSDIEGLSSCHVVRYEDLCSDPLAVARELFGFAGLRWETQTERFIQASTSHGESDYYSVFKNPTDSANRWKKELSSDAVDAVMKAVGDTTPGRLYTQ